MVDGGMCAGLGRRRRPGARKVRQAAAAASAARLIHTARSTSAPVDAGMPGLGGRGLQTMHPGSPAREAKNKGCAACEGCCAAQQGECCGECVKSKHEVFPVMCTGEYVPIQKAKKSKKKSGQDYFIVAPIAQPMPPQCGPIAIATSMPMPPMPAPQQPMMVFRVASASKASECVG